MSIEYGGLKNGKTGEFTGRKKEVIPGGPGDKREYVPIEEIPAPTNLEARYDREEENDSLEPSAEDKRAKEIEDRLGIDDLDPGHTMHDEQVAEAKVKGDSFEYMKDEVGKIEEAFDQKPKAGWFTRIKNLLK